MMHFELRATVLSKAVWIYAYSLVYMEGYVRLYPDSPSVFIFRLTRSLRLCAMASWTWHRANLPSPWTKFTRSTEPSVTRPGDSSHPESAVWWCHGSGGHGRMHPYIYIYIDRENGLFPPPWVGRPPKTMRYVSIHTVSMIDMLQKIVFSCGLVVVVEKDRRVYF